MDDAGSTGGVLKLVFRSVTCSQHASKTVDVKVQSVVVIGFPQAHSPVFHVGIH